jgi:hypothetical protein
LTGHFLVLDWPAGGAVDHLLHAGLVVRATPVPICVETHAALLPINLLPRILPRLRPESGSHAEEQLDPAQEHAAERVLQHRVEDLVEGLSSPRPFFPQPLPVGLRRPVDIGILPLTKKSHSSPAAASTCPN